MRFALASRWSALALLAALAAGGCMSTETAVEKIEIRAGSPWAAKTAYELDAGERYTVEVAPMDLWSSGGWTGNAEGAEIQYGRFPVPGSRAYGLIGRIGETGETGEPFFVGVDFEGVAESSGALYLGMTDVPGNFEDNEGSVTAILSVSTPRKRKTRPKPD